MKALTKKIAKIFFGVDSAEEMKKEGFKFSAGWSAYWFFEYILMLVTAVLVGFLLEFGWSERNIFLFLWVGCMVVNYGIVFADEKTAVDFTAMNGSRRIVSVSWDKAKRRWWLIPVFGLFMAGWLLWLAIWQGPAAVIIFLQTRKKIARALLLTGVSAIQMLIWTKVYIFGYDCFQAVWSLWH